MTTIGYFVIYLLSGEVYVSEDRVNCNKMFAHFEHRMDEFGIEMLQCFDPITSIRPVARPERK